MSSTQAPVYVVILKYTWKIKEWNCCISMMMKAERSVESHREMKRKGRLVFIFETELTS